MVSHNPLSASQSQIHNRPTHHVVKTERRSSFPQCGNAKTKSRSCLDDQTPTEKALQCKRETEREPVARLRAFQLQHQLFPFLRERAQLPAQFCGEVREPLGFDGGDVDT